MNDPDPNFEASPLNFVRSDPCRNSSRCTLQDEKTKKIVLLRPKTAHDPEEFLDICSMAAAYLEERQLEDMITRGLVVIGEADDLGGGNDPESKSQLLERLTSRWSDEDHHQFTEILYDTETLGGTRAAYKWLQHYRNQVSQSDECLVNDLTHVMPLVF